MEETLIGLSFWSNPILFPRAGPIFDFSALEYDVTSLEYDFQGMPVTPSCKGLRVDLMDQTNHIQEFTHVRAPNWPRLLI